MGHGRYSRTSYDRLRTRKGYGQKRREEIFTSRGLDPEMDPRRVLVRESRDSDEHPESLSIVIALDVTGSMGMVPEDIVKNSLPDLMDSLVEAGIHSPQILFMGIGDYIYDDAPLQVGQFESSAELLDRWLTRVYLEGGGGGNNCESYNLAYLFAARHTAIDCWEKRRRKGFLFTIGDEPCAKRIPGKTIRALTASRQAGSVTTGELIAEARERYEVMHLHIEHNAHARTERRKEGWRELLGSDFITLENYRDLARTIADLVISRAEPAARAEPPPTPALQAAPALPLVEEML